MRQRARHPDSPLVRLLRDPGSELRQLLDLIRDALAQVLPYPGPGAGLQEDDAAPMASGERTLVCCELRLSRPHWRLLGGSDGTDPLRLVLGQLAGLERDEQALVQVLARPATAREQARLLAIARRLRAGQPLGRAQRLLDLLGPTPATPRRASADPTIAPEVREALTKAGQPLFRVLVRLAVVAPTSPRARGRIHALCGAFAAYEGSVGLRRRRRRPERRPGRRPARPHPRRTRGAGRSARSARSRSARPERARGRGRRSRHRPASRDLPPRLRAVLGTEDRRHPPRRAADTA